jgi:hypothetical protein
MNKKTNEYTVHLINAKGERIHLPYSESVQLDKLITEGKSEEYYADVEWYLSHGYITITQMRNEIENGGFK